ncbi:unnamed protein product [Anisakis simplex]|uniref:Uncharacterized protein n=1 Tax=Anisakis simplex TaxID=6269 RepID=A0A3P6PR37_ANISI|nr:unnamed protein product [Anisakis simplex]
MEALKREGAIKDVLVDDKKRWSGDNEVSEVNNINDDNNNECENGNGVSNSDQSVQSSAECNHHFNAIDVE